MEERRPVGHGGWTQGAESEEAPWVCSRRTSQEVIREGRGWEGADPKRGADFGGGVGQGVGKGNPACAW